MNHSSICQRFFAALVLGVASLCFASCAGLYGIHQPRDYTTLFDPYNCRTTNAACSIIFPNGGPVTLGKAYWKSLEKQLPNHPRTKDLSQALQFWLYHRDTLVYATVNCRAPSGLFNLHWKIGQDRRLEVESGSGPNRVQHIQLVEGDTFSMSLQPESEYYAVIVYSRFMGRQNRRFLRAVNGYLKEHQYPLRNPYRIYAQADSLFMD